MRISLVTPVFNGMPWLPEAVESVAGQRGDVDIQHIILDAGSTDGSRAWLDEHRELGYVTVFDPDEGQTDALAKGFGLATGEVFGWLNADDLLEPGALDTVARTFGREPDAVIVSGRCLQIGPDGGVLGTIETPPQPDFRELLNHPTNLAQPATFFRAEAYRRVGGLDRQYNLAMDVDLWFRLARTGRVALLPGETLARFRLHPAAKSVADLTGAIREDLSIRLKNGVSWGSPAARALVLHGWILPSLRRLKRSVLGGRERTD
jgi:glycosyltransferase involved in cell wall biosynthesis